MDREQSDKRERRGDDKVTPFRPDRRPALAGVLRTLGLFIMLAAVLYALWAYQDDLHIENLKRLISYAKAAGAADAGDFATYSFEPGLDTVYAPYDLGLAVVSSDTYRFVTGFGGQSFSVQLGYGNPALAVSGRNVLIYDRGNRGYCIANSYMVVHAAQSASDIVAAAMNARGDYMLVKEESGYRAGVYVYDYKNREVCVWQTPSYYVMLPSLGPDGDRFAVLCADGAGYQVRGYDVGVETPVYTLDFAWRQVYAIGHDKNGTLFILCEDGLYTYDQSGTPSSSYPFRGLLRFALHEGGLPMVALRATHSGGEHVRLVAFGPDGQPVWESTVQGSLRDLDFRGEYGAALFYNELYTLDLTGESPVFARREAPGVRQVLATAQGQSILVYSNRAESVSIRPGN